MNDKLIVGSLEMCSLPELGIEELEVRVDTGAKTSSLHVDNLRKVKRRGKPWAKFDIQPNVFSVDSAISCEAEITDVRRIKSSNGVSEKRYVIVTEMRLGDVGWPVEITLTNRSDMNYLMLLGRQGMSNRLLVDPSRTFLLSEAVTD